MARLRQADTPRPASFTPVHGTLPAPQSISKWDMLREITAARKSLGLSDRDLTVLQALISFHPGADLSGGPGQMVVYPSNAAICARLNGMPDSTMRRHLAALVSAGILTRRDSPNGKRYARRNRAGGVAFGFDLWPLVARREEILATAAAERRATEELHHLRETVSLMRRDLAALVLWGETEHPSLPAWTRLANLGILSGRTLRRKPVREDLLRLQSVLAAALAELGLLLDLTSPDEPTAEEMSSNAADNEQHIQNSEKDLIESESGVENMAMADTAQESRQGRAPAPLPLRLVLDACGEVQTYAAQKIASWRDLLTACETLRPMMGISPDLWHEARRRLGNEDAAIVLSAMLQRFAAIRSPGAYLRRLIQKAGEGDFSPTPMILALMRQAA